MIDEKSSELTPFPNSKTSKAQTNHPHSTAFAEAAAKAVNSLAEQAQKSDTDNPLRYVKEGPKLGEVLAKPDPRDNIVTSYDQQAGYRTKTQMYTEREGLQNLASFLETTAIVAHETGDLEVEENALAFRENLVFVGEPELREATAGIAAHMLEKVKAGKSVYVYVGNMRSERYITLRVLEEFEKLTENDPGLRAKVRFSQNEFQIARNMKKTPDSIALVPDDFVVSGNRIQGFADKMFRALVKEGYSPDEAVSKIEATVVASAVDKRPLKLGSPDEEKLLKMFSYYGLRQYKKPSGELYVFSGISLSGSHSSTDYGFESPLESFINFLGQHGQAVKPPLLTQIRRPYETERGEYQDSDLSRRWRTLARYSV